MRKIATFLKEMLFPVKADALEATLEEELIDEEEDTLVPTDEDSTRLRAFTLLCADVYTVSDKFFEKYVEPD